MPKGIMIAVGMPKNGGKSDIGSPGGLDEPMPKRGAMPQQHEAGGEEEGESGTPKVSPQDVDYREGELCRDCANMGAEGDCELYEFPVAEEGHCLKGFSPKGESGQQPEEGEDMGSMASEPDGYGVSR